MDEQLGEWNQFLPKSQTGTSDNLGEWNQFLPKAAASPDPNLGEWGQFLPKASLNPETEKAVAATKDLASPSTGLSVIPLTSEGLPDLPKFADEHPLGEKIAKRVSQNLFPQSIGGIPGWVAGLATPVVGSVQGLVADAKEAKPMFENAMAQIQGQPIPHPEIAPKTYDKFSPDDWINWGVDVGLNTAMLAVPEFARRMRPEESAATSIRPTDQTQPQVTETRPKEPLKPGGETVNESQAQQTQQAETGGQTNVVPEEAGGTVKEPPATPTMAEKDASTEAVTPQTEQSQPLPEEATGIAQRVHDERARSNQLGEIMPGEGVSAETMIERGRTLIDKGGVDPVAVADRIRQTNQVSGDDIAVLRARMEQLSRETNSAEDAANADPKNPELKTNYERAFKTETDWAQNAVKPAQTEWHKMGQAQQGETAIDTGTYSGLRRAFQEQAGRDVNPSEAVKLKQTVERVRKISDNADTAKSNFSDLVDKETAGRQPKSLDELRQRFADRIRAKTPC